MSQKRPNFSLTGPKNVKYIIATSTRKTPSLFAFWSFLMGFSSVGF